jgi:AraC-like DNA-binding protein
VRRYENTNFVEHRVENNLFRNERLVQQFRIFMEEAISQPAQLKTNEKLFGAFVHLLHENLRGGSYMETISGEANPALPGTAQTEDFSNRLRRYIQSHLQERPTLQTAARAMYLSRTQLARRVRAETGKTYLELVNEHRLETAKELLANTDWTISNIAIFIGYKTPHYFHIYFRRETEMTPNQYRLAARKKSTFN